MYEARFSVRGKSISKYAPTREGALRALAQMSLEAGRGYPDHDRISTAEYLERWLTDVVAPRTRYRTVTTYRDLLTRHVVPHIGAVALAHVTPMTMDGLQAAHRRSKTPAASAYLACTILKTAFRDAAVKGVIPRNPFADVRLKRPKAEIMKTWTLDECRVFLAATAGSPLAVFYTLAITMGFRHGELLALRWTDVDLVGGSINVERNLEERGAGVVNPEAPVKAGAGTLLLPSGPLQALRALRAANPETIYVFTGPDGSFYRRKDVYRLFEADVKAAGVPKIRVHDLRHTCATLLWEAGKDMKEIQAQLRHGSLATTAGTYMHFTREKALGNVAAMDSMFGAGGAK